jgi:hypothetical protein
MDTITVSKANTKIEDTPVRTIIMGEVYLERKETGKSQHSASSARKAKCC